jgi:hypothetical protein
LPRCALLEELRQSGLDVDTLSMGMSADMPAAIAEGATMVRIGTAIFGARADGPSPTPPRSTDSSTPADMRRAGRQEP